MTLPASARASADFQLWTYRQADMLLHQAVTGFELWFGTRPEVTREQYELLAADIA